MPPKSSKSSKTDVWKHILITLNPSDTYPFICTADQLKSCKKSWKGASCQFEPRLLAYQTTDKERPDIFKQKGIYILPIKNGTYLIHKVNIYQPIEYIDTPPCKLLRNTRSLLLTIGQSECSIIDNMRYSGIFERPELLGEPILFGPLLNGRHRTPHFKSVFDKKQLSIEGVQFEIDSCFESEHKILILEAKAEPTKLTTFNIRQLYYPFRTIYEKVKEKKDILCAFVHSYKNIIYIWTYVFTDPQNIKSLTLKGAYSYSITDD